jgi:hypothetical protein
MTLTIELIGLVILGIIICPILTLLLVVFGIYNSVYMIAVYTGLFNPKYAALQELLRLSGYLK